MSQTLRELFQKQLDKPGQQLQFWPRVFYLTYESGPAYGVTEQGWPDRLTIQSMPVSEIDTCKLVPAENQDQMTKLGSMFPLLYDPEMLKLWYRDYSSESRQP